MFADAGTRSETRERLQIVLPVHNEAESIAGVLSEIHAALAPTLEIEFILSEDGSRDGTPEVLRELATRLPAIVMSEPRRKGYARAVLDALDRAETTHVLFLDSDGQYDPRDFWDLYAHREAYDVVKGWRKPRSDTFTRRLMSRAFGLVHRMFFRVSLHDASCSFVLMRRAAVRPLLPELGVLTEGFWWEFTARAALHGLRILEVPVRHRPRAAGQTRVYHPGAVPGIAWRNLRGLFVIWREARRVRPTPRGQDHDD
jgi:dolichol-phosphate mannosyltransferase